MAEDQALKEDHLTYQRIMRPRLLRQVKDRPISVARRRTPELKTYHDIKEFEKEFGQNPDYRKKKLERLAREEIDSSRRHRKTLREFEGPVGELMRKVISGELNLEDLKENKPWEYREWEPGRDEEDGPSYPSR